MADPQVRDLASRVAAKVGAGPATSAAPKPRGALKPNVVGMRSAKLGESVMLMPGELYFGAEAGNMKTLLGSCVALTLWHPKKRIGGMCHFLLPGRARQSSEPLDGRYGDEAVLAMVNLLEGHGCRSSEFVAHLYGGADTMADSAGVKLNVGERNIERGWSLIDHFGFTLDGVDVGDNVPRTVSLTLVTGQVDCRRGNGHGT